MTAASTKLLQEETPIHKGIIASVSTLSCIDKGFLTLEEKWVTRERGEFTGRLEHLKRPDLFKDAIFTIRFLDGSQLIELENCRLIDINTNGELTFLCPNGFSSLQVSNKLEIMTRKMFELVQYLMASRQYKNIVFVMGAGASIDVLPGGANLLREMLRSSPHEEIQRFINEVFKASVEQPEIPFPSFNQVLSVIDIALEREEGFNAKYSLDKLRAMKKILIEELRKYLIDQADDGSQSSYTELATQLKDFYDSGSRISFITMNYDLYLDQALIKVFGREKLDYILPLQPWGNGDTNGEFTSEEIEQPKNKISVIKLHGSLDWMICPTCFKAFQFLKQDLPKALARRTCTEDNTDLKEFLFPPTRERIEVHSHWIRLQHEADQLLRKADKVVFVGFSLSDDDAHFRFKLKKHLYRPQNPVCIQVIGSPKKEFDIATDKVSWQYWQYFGPIDYRPIGFAEFAKRPY